jgi:hypothetical protein
MGPGGISPAKVSGEVTKALQESITSLLGKRSNSDEDAGVGGGQQPSKAGKRVRPQPKSKVIVYSLFKRIACAHYCYLCRSYNPDTNPANPFKLLNHPLLPLLLTTAH